MPSYPHIARYHADLQRFREFGGSDNEQSIRRAFAVCLDSYCRDHREKLALVDELNAGSRVAGSRAAGSGIRPDGTVKDSLRMARGYWEAKDSHDNLDAEIQAKFNRGYPRDNILFEDSQTAVLFQNREEAMRVDMSRPGELHRLIRRFLDYELPEIGEFRQARQQFKADLPSVLDNLRAAVGEAEADNADYRAAADVFLDLCRQTISPEVSDADVREMLLQHILTKDIFLRVFAEDQFHRENNVARQLDALEQTFFTGDVRRQAIDRLRAYYGAIGRAADEIADYAEKQQFLKAVYEDFYQAYNPAAADRLGVVYTPNEVVDFIIRGTDYLLQKHFGRALADQNVQILDPATGTGTFITNLINYLPADRLEYKYRHEIHANEVAILPYYIANLNIEYTYRERTGQYREFPNLCFVDTLDNMDWQGAGATGGAVTRQAAFNLGGLSEENWLRVQEQNEQPISVIIGNPPYNATQRYWNDFNPNRAYPEIDRRIRETYTSASTAQNRHKQYDMYKRFLRWASDRLADDGIIGFVTNRAYLDSRQDDGFRQVAAAEFTDIYVLDLGSDVRRNPKISGTTHNVFGIQTGVAIAFLVRDKSRSGRCNIHYARREDDEIAAHKLAYLREAKLDGIDFAEITPDAKNNWLNQSDSDFETLLPLANREAKFAKSVADEQAVFSLFSNGVITARDEWVYDFAADNLNHKARFFADTYNGFLETGNESYDPVIKWSRNLRRHFEGKRGIDFTEKKIIAFSFRPFVTKWYFADSVMSNDLTGNHYEMFGSDLRQPNEVICFSGVASSKPFQALATGKLFGFDTLEKTQCLPRYRYTADGERVSNITEWGLRQFREHYGDDGITAEDVFAYVYAMLHDPAYRQKYEVDLRREFPRVYFQADFHWWAGKGRELLDLHTGFESVEPWPLERGDVGSRFRGNDGLRSGNAGPGSGSDGPGSGSGGGGGKAILRADQERGIIRLDERTALSGVPADAWLYQLGSRSALEWVLDQYKERKPRDPTIRERFNTYRFADHKERVIDLLRRVCAVSVATVRIVGELDLWTEVDPDEGRELRPEFVAGLLQSAKEAKAAGQLTIPDERIAELEEIVKGYDLDP